MEVPNRLVDVHLMQAVAISPVLNFNGNLLWFTVTHRGIRDALINFCKPPFTNDPGYRVAINGDSYELTVSSNQ